MSRIRDVAQIGLVKFVKWGRNTDSHHIHLADLCVIGCRVKPLLLRILDSCCRNPDDVRCALVELLNLLRINIEAGNPETLFTEQQR